jgi:hypothetical protein
VAAVTAMTSWSAGLQTSCTACLLGFSCPKCASAAAATAAAAAAAAAAAVCTEDKHHVCQGFRRQHALLLLLPLLLLLLLQMTVCHYDAAQNKYKLLNLTSAGWTVSACTAPDPPAVCCNLVLPTYAEHSTHCIHGSAVRCTGESSMRCVPLSLMASTEYVPIQCCDQGSQAHASALTADAAQPMCSILTVSVKLLGFEGLNCMVPFIRQTQIDGKHSQCTNTAGPCAPQDVHSRHGKDCCDGTSAMCPSKPCLTDPATSPVIMNLTTCKCTTCLFCCVYRVCNTLTDGPQHYLQICRSV